MFNPSQVAERVAAISRMFEMIAPQLTEMAGVDANTSQMVGTAIADLQQCAAAFATADRAAAGSLVDRVSGDVQSVCQALENTDLPPQVAMPLRIAEMMIPVLTLAVEMIWQQNIVPVAPAGPASP